jgi:hypothetical protein
MALRVSPRPRTPHIVKAGNQGLRFVPGFRRDSDANPEQSGDSPGRLSQRLLRRSIAVTAL